MRITFREIEADHSLYDGQAENKGGHAEGDETRENDEITQS